MITDPGRLIASFTWSENTFSIAGTAQQILSEDKYRIGFMIGIQTGNNIWISTRPDLTASNGFLIQGSLEPFQLDYRSFGAVVGASWYAIGGFMAVNTTVLESRYDPRNQRV